MAVECCRIVTSSLSSSIQTGARACAYARRHPLASTRTEDDSEARTQRTIHTGAWPLSQAQAQRHLSTRMTPRT
eukprot:6206523-Pleurochrysis_carterae.AAC.1